MFNIRFFSFKELILDCGHSLCHSCVNVLTNKAENFICPVCRKPTMKSRTKVDFTLKGVRFKKDFVSQAKGASSLLKESGFRAKQSDLCCGCGQQRATLWCSHCGEFCIKCSATVSLRFQCSNSLVVIDSCPGKVS